MECLTGSLFQRLKKTSAHDDRMVAGSYSNNKKLKYFGNSLYEK